jgi:hypothetical protein
MAISTATPIDRPISPHLEATTHRCSEHGHREFVLRWDERRTSLADVRRLAETLEAEVARGAKFKPGDVVHVGWVPLRVVEAPTRALSLVEPDFCGAPLRYVAGVDAAIHHLRLQDDLGERLGLGDFLARPLLKNTVRVCGHLTSRGIVLDRTEPSGNDSGWLVTCEEADDDHAVTTSTVYDLVSRFPHLVDFLALPAGCTVACTDGGDAIVWQDGHEVGVRNGVTMAARLSRVTAPLARCGSIR